ncbi:unnamed protein product [Rhodiola kirilowii]
MKQPKGFVDRKFPDHVCHLNKSIYGLKQSPRQWNRKFDACMTDLDFSKSKYDSCLYFDVPMNGILFGKTALELFELMFRRSTNTFWNFCTA